IEQPPHLMMYGIAVMKSLASALAVMTVVAMVGLPPQAQGGSAFRTPWGDPDIQGLFTTDDELGVPFERPEQFAGRDVVSDKEFAHRQTQAARQAETDAEEFVAPRTGRGGDGTGPPAHWLERGKPSRRPSVVNHPPHGADAALNRGQRNTR